MRGLGERPIPGARKLRSVRGGTASIGLHGAPRPQQLAGPPRVARQSLELVSSRNTSAFLSRRTAHRGRHSGGHAANETHGSAAPQPRWAAPGRNRRSIRCGVGTESAGRCQARAAFDRPIVRRLRAPTTLASATEAERYDIGAYGVQRRRSARTFRSGDASRGLRGLELRCTVGQTAEPAANWLVRSRPDVRALEPGAHARRTSSDRQQPGRHSIRGLGATPGTIRGARLARLASDHRWLVARFVHRRAGAKLARRVGSRWHLAATNGGEAEPETVLLSRCTEQVFVKSIMQHGDAVRLPVCLTATLALAWGLSACTRASGKAAIQNKNPSSRTLCQRSNVRSEHHDETLHGGMARRARTTSGQQFIVTIPVGACVPDVSRGSRVALHEAIFRQRAAPRHSALDGMISRLYTRPSCNTR
jgi:hypothetical protein